VEEVKFGRVALHNLRHHVFMDREEEPGHERIWIIIGVLMVVLSLVSLFSEKQDGREQHQRESEGRGRAASEAVLR
jgi:hypothetical protein